MHVFPKDFEFNLALEKKLSHKAPFGFEELSKIKNLNLERVNEISEIQYCVGLESLELKYSNLTKIDILSKCTKIKSLKIIGLPISNIDFIEHFIHLEQLTLQFTFIQNAFTIFKLKKLKKAILEGNPWSKKFYADLESHLLKNTSSLPLLSFSSSFIWEFCVKMNQYGCLYAYIDSRGFLVRPGSPKIPNSECDFFKIHLGYLEYILKKEYSSPNEIFSAISKKRLLGSYKIFNKKNRFQIYFANDISQHINSSSLLKKEKKNLLKFTSSFPNAIFYYESLDYLEEMATKEDVIFPNWFLMIRQVLTFLYPNQDLTINFKQFSLNQSQFDMNRWFSFQLYDSISNDYIVVIEKKKLVAIGHAGNYIICINIQGTDKKIYQYNYFNYAEAETEILYPIFNSYSEMLSCIDSIKLDTGKIIHSI